MVKENKQVLLGMSGGTDSSVAAILLQDAGYEVIGVTFRFYEVNDDTEYLQDAKALAARLGMEHIAYDVRDVFQREIVDYFINGYLSGQTPVPCTLCNNFLKWPLLAKIDDERGIYYLATGHYVQKKLLEGKYYLTPGVDKEKDQSFFLWGLKQDILERMLLPMGQQTKPAARALATKRGFAKVAVKRDSIGVCFCPLDYRTFLKSWATITRGKFVDENGQFIAWHQGYPFYTIGQRRGLGVALNRPVFVKEIRPQQNEVVLASLAALNKTEMLLKDWNIIDLRRLLGYDDIIVKIRYRKQANYCTVTITPEGLLHVQLHQPLAAVATGQAAAFYKDGLLLGGGIILSSLS